MSQELIESYVLDEAYRMGGQRLKRSRDAISIAKTRAGLVGRLVNGRVDDDISYSSGHDKFDNVSYELTIGSYEVGSISRSDLGTHGDQIVSFTAHFRKDQLKWAEKHEKAFLRGLKAMTKKAFKPLAKLGKVSSHERGGGDTGTQHTVTVPSADSDKVIQAMGQAVKAWGVGLNALRAKYSPIEGVGAESNLIEDFLAG
jgi:hypothetical protein